MDFRKGSDISCMPVLNHYCSETALTLLFLSSYQEKIRMTYNVEMLERLARCSYCSGLSLFILPEIFD